MLDKNKPILVEALISGLPDCGTTSVEISASEITLHSNNPRDVICVLKTLPGWENLTVSPVISITSKRNNTQTIMYSGDVDMIITEVMSQRAEEDSVVLFSSVNDYCRASIKNGSFGLTDTHASLQLVAAGEGFNEHYVEVLKSRAIAKVKDALGFCYFGNIKLSLVAFPTSTAKNQLDTSLVDVTMDVLNRRVFKTNKGYHIWPFMKKDGCYYVTVYDVLNVTRPNKECTYLIVTKDIDEHDREIVGKVPDDLNDVEELVRDICETHNAGKDILTYSKAGKMLQDRAGMVDFLDGQDNATELNCQLLEFFTCIEHYCD